MGMTHGMEVLTRDGMPIEVPAALG